ncbi:MAG: MarR family transcriptional regulator [Candidatus Sericytochromatia bacterium]|nr:MarR family transcriptional regulator [Candidatus Sericytochromatia bacterium]
MPTHYSGPPQEIQALNAFINLIRAADSISAKINTALSDYGLTETQFGVLESLFHLGSLCQKALADKLLKSNGNITMVIDNLEKQELVLRQRDSRDRRYITIHLTPKGQSLMEKIFPAHVGRITTLMGVLNPEEQEALRQLCRKLGKHAQELCPETLR